MTEATVSMDVRTPDESVSVIDIEGEITAACEPILMDAYGRASGDRTRCVILNFTGLEYMNSSGIGLVTNALASDADAGVPGVPYCVSGTHPRASTTSEISALFSGIPAAAYAVAHAGCA